MHNTVWIIFNGPSSKEWHNYRFKGPVFGCNFAYRDFPVTDLFVADRPTVHQVRKDDPRGVFCYTKRTSLELPPGWRHLDMPGIDSGTFAFEQACIRYPQSHLVVIGADGILDQAHETVYEYSFRRGHQPTQEIHKRHQKTMIELITLYDPNYTFISEHGHSVIKTMSKEQFLSKEH